jgi:putative N6-adenine-specific DNA methylase
MQTTLTYQQLVATTLAGLEAVCAQELEALGATHVEAANRAVRFQGDKAIMYKTNYCSRTALRILVPLADYAVEDTEAYYKVINGYAWEKLFTCDNTFAIEVVGNHPSFTNSMFAAQKCKDAIVDRFRSIYDKRPGVDLDQPHVRIHIHLQRERITVSLDSSGEPLFKRGYRIGSVPAPLNEVLAAGLILLSGWDRKLPFFDPFCGSGTIPIEAALMAKEAPAGKFRTSWGFMKWADYDEALWNTVKAEADALQHETETEIYASDIDIKNLNIARRNMEAAGVHALIKTTPADFNTYAFPQTPGIIVANPPYGERLRPFDMVGQYKAIGDTLKHHCPGYQAWLIGSDMETMKFIGLKPDKKIIVFNGPLECRFMKFSIFDGSRKQMKTPKADS